MPNKEEYIKEHGVSERSFLIYCINVLVDDDIRINGDNINDLKGFLYELVEEHFEPKENTSEFKHFKLHSDSTLKNLTKVELIDYIKMLYHNWGVCDEQLKNCIDANTKLKGKYSKILDDVHDYRFETHHMKMTIRNLCEHFGVKSEKELQNMYLNKPLEFEDLKLDVPYWDDKEKSYCFFTTLNPKMKTGVKIEITNPPTICAFRYEPNRFYQRELNNEQVICNIR